MISRARVGELCLTVRHHSVGLIYDMQSRDLLSQGERAFGREGRVSLVQREDELQVGE